MTPTEQRAYIAGLERAAEICKNRAAEYRDGKRGAMHEHVYAALQAEETALGLYASLRALAATLPQETVPNNTPAAPSDTPRLDRDWWRAQGIEACMDRMELMAEQQRELNALRATVERDRALNPEFWNRAYIAGLEKAAEWHDRLGSMIDQVGNPDYSLREFIAEARRIRDDMLAFRDTLAAAPKEGSKWPS